MRFWTTDKVETIDSGKLYYICRKPWAGQRLAAKRYYSTYTGWPRMTIPKTDGRIYVICGIGVNEAVCIAHKLKNCAVYAHSSEQIHFLPLWWLPAAPVWGYYVRDLIGVWLNGKKYTAEKLCKKCPLRLRRTVEMCLPLAQNCKLPFSLATDDENDFKAFEQFCTEHSADWNVLPKELFVSLKKAARTPRGFAKTVDDL